MRDEGVDPQNFGPGPEDLLREVGEPLQDATKVGQPVVEAGVVVRGKDYSLVAHPLLGLFEHPLELFGQLLFGAVFQLFGLELDHILTSLK